MASEAKTIVGQEMTDAGLVPMDEERERAFIREGLDDLADGRWVDHAAVKADIEAMRAELKTR